MPIVPSFWPAPRLLRRFCAALLAASTAAFAQTPSAADGFDPNVDGNVYALATQPDGKTIIAGQFGAVRPNGTVGSVRNNLARLNSDGSLDFSFDPNANGPVRVLVLQADGKILIGGDFTALQPNGVAAATKRSCLARLNADGSLDATFLPEVSGAPLNQVYALLPQPNGVLIVGGNFFSATPAVGSGGILTRHHLARFASNGIVDGNYDPEPDALVFALAQHSDGKILVAGGFTSFLPNNTINRTTRNRLARLNSDGTPDSEFDPRLDNRATSLAVQRDGKILVGGDFASLTPNGGASVAHSRLARLNPDGTLDASFTGNASGNVAAIAVLPDGTVLAGGSFSSVWSGATATVGRPNLAHFLPDGTVDLNYAAGANAIVDAFALQADGRVIIGGYFTGLQPRGATASTVRNRVARINPDGSLDATLDLDFGGRPLVEAVQKDGKILIGGSFTSVGGVTHNHLARLNADGTVDTAFNPDFNGLVLTMVVQPADQKILVGGTFTTIGGETRNFIARLNPSGTIDSEFNPNANAQVATIALQGDGKILLGGSFGTLQPIGVATPKTRSNVARLNADGSLDATFHPNTNTTVNVITVQTDGKILLGGSFSSITPEADLTITTTTAATVPSDKAGSSSKTNGNVTTNTTVSIVNNVTTTTVGSTSPATARNYIVRMNADGTVDTTFDPNLNSSVNAIALQSDGKIIIGGAFSALRPNGTLVTTPRNRLARLNADGTLDATFDPNANGIVLTVALQADGKILVGGAFTTFTPNLAPNTTGPFTLRKYAGRLNTDGTVDATFNLDLNELNGNRVDSWLVLPDGRILLGGNFISLQPIGAAARLGRTHFARINANGTLDSAFQPNVGGVVTAQINALALQSDGKLVVAGAFADLGGATTANLARFNPDGTPDVSFYPLPGADGPVAAVLVRADTSPVVPQGSGLAWINANGSVHTAFAPALTSRISGSIDAIAIQPDGGVLVGGTFTNSSGIPGPNLVRFSPSGNIDTNFGPSPDGPVEAIVVQPDGRILIAGSFTTVAGAARNYVARINADGTLDSSFDPSPGARTVAIALQADGKIILGGTFTGLSPNTSGLVTTTTTTSTSTTNAPSTTNTVTNANGTTTTTSISTIAGVTTTVVSTVATPITRNYLARVNTDGSVDPNYNPTPGSNVNALLLQPDGRLIVGGAFNTITPTTTTIVTNTPNAGNNSSSKTNADGTITTTNVSTTTGTTTTTVSTTYTRNHLARLNPDGTVDTGYDPNFNDTVFALAFFTDGKVIAGGVFTSLSPNGGGSFTRNRLARLNTDGTTDSNFDPNIISVSAVSSIAVQSDAKIVFGGTFNALQPNGATIPTVRNRIARVNFDGTIDTTYNPDADGPVNALALATDGSLVVGGTFTAVSPSPTLLIGGTFNTIGGVATKNLALLGDDGSPSSLFTPNPNGAINALLAQPDGKFIVAGNFTNIAGAARLGLARFNSDNSLDASFNPSLPGFINAIALQPDGKILVATNTLVTRLNADGTADNSFSLTSVGSLRNFRALTVQPDGKILYLGLNGALASNDVIGRWNASGSPDNTFFTVSGLANSINNFALQTDGHLIVIGSFATAVGSNFPVIGPAPAIPRINRLNADGTIDTAYNPAPDGPVTALALQNDGRVLIGGAFTSVGGLPRSSLARLAATSPMAQTLSANRTTVILVRSGSGPELSGVTFEQSTDTQTWTKLGTAGRVGGTSNWQLNGLNLPASGLFYIRARGLAPAGGGKSSGVIESVREFNLAAVPGVGPASGSTATEDIGGLLIDSATGLITGQSAPSSAPAMTSLPIGIIAQSILGTDGFSTGTARLSNFSARARVSPGGVLMTGFAVSGTESRTLLLRAAGPSLGTFGVTGVLAAPRLQLFDGAGRLLRENSGWGANAAEVSAAGTRTGAFPFSSSASADAAMVVTLTPGTYSMQVLDGGGAGGVTLAEIYDAGDLASGSQIVNLSIRGDVNFGDGAFLSGFVLAGNAPRRVLVRGDGPALTQFGVPGALADPMVSVFTGTGELLAANDNWSATTGGVLSAGTAALLSATHSVGAFGLDVGSKDAALTLTLVPGTYTVQVTAANKATGAALIEIYELP